MSVPETTSAEAFWRYAGGECLFESRGEAWRDIKAWLTALPPVIDTFLKEHLFADIFARDILDHRSRELATVAALSSMTGTRSQLQLHLGAAINVGLSEAQMRDFISVLAAEVGERESEGAGEVLTAVLNSRK